MKLRHLPLVWKLWLSTSVALALLFVLTVWVVQRQTVQTTTRNLEEQVQESFRVYESLWLERTVMLQSISSILSSMPNVRAAFGTKDQATIRDSAGELWAKISADLKENAFFDVTDPQGNSIAALGDEPVADNWPIVRAVTRKFPQQVSGVVVRNHVLCQLVITPVYVDSSQGPALISVLVAGYRMNQAVAENLKRLTGGSDFMFISAGRAFASTLDERATRAAASSLAGDSPPSRVNDGEKEYALLAQDLISPEGTPVAKLCVFRSFEDVERRLSALRRDISLMWLVAFSAGLALTYVLARKIVQPVEELDRAAAEIAHQNYGYRVPVHTEDELGRLAKTFNTMCESIESGREELIRQERIATIGRLASSIVHDLRNPLAAIYGGAEMLVDTELSPPQVKRLAANLYTASRRILELLQDLVNVSRGKADPAEICKLRDLVQAATDMVRGTAESQDVKIAIEVPDAIELPLERARVERVFLNLLSNSLEAMPAGGNLRISASVNNGSVLIEVRDTGTGISPEIRDRLFQPFVSAGKKNGLGLGLALSRQTVLDHDGELWAAPENGPGACFQLRFPLERVRSEQRTVSTVNS
jgi:signal transduction histidine kinase